jgi:hypothetical protein
MAMNRTLQTGVWIGVLCVAWTFVVGLTGWYKDPALAVPLFLVPVILIEVVLLVLGLRKTAPAQGYGKQVLTGTLMSVVAAAIIFCGSMLFTTVAFPTYFQDLRDAHAEMLRAAGRSAVEIETEVAKAAVGQTPLANALAGVAGTIGTGLVASLVVAIFLRRK